MKAKFFAAIFCLTVFSSCSLWEDRWTEIVPLPEVNDQIEVDGWVDEQDSEKEIGY